MSPLEIVATRLNPAEAELSFTLAVTAPEGATVELRGKVSGPTSPYAETIDVSYPLRPLPREGDLVRARVILPEPSLWTPAAPLLYHARVAVAVGDDVREERTVGVGLKECRLGRKGLFLNGVKLMLRGLAARRLDPDTASDWRNDGVNLVTMPVVPELADAWDAADRLGFFVLGSIDPTTDDPLWLIQDKLLQHSSVLGWLLPQTTLTEPQRWHQAMSLLHGWRRDVFIGVLVEELPLPILPGHVDFLACGQAQLAALDHVQTPKLVMLRRGEAYAPPPLQTALLGRVARV
jgi:hypothetical protein